jgi:hypothetical protein
MKAIDLKTKFSSHFFLFFLLGFLFFGFREITDIIYPPSKRIVATIGILLIFGSPFYFRIKFYYPLVGNIRFFFNLYIIWVFIILVRPILTGQVYSSDSLNPNSIFGLYSYLIFLVTFIDKRTFSFKIIFNIIYVFAICGLVYFVLNFYNMLYIVNIGPQITKQGNNFGLGELGNSFNFWFGISCFSLLCFEFLPTNRYKKIAFFSSFFNLLLLGYLGRRGGIFMSCLYFLGAFFLNFKIIKKNRYFVMICIIILIIVILINLYSISIISNFSILSERLTEDTRSGVDNDIINHLTSKNLWFFGQGIEGAYKSNDFERLRYEHETGYFFLILKGGILYLIFFVSILLHAAYIGFFKTRNRFTKAISLYIFFHLIYLVPFGLPSFSLEYLLMWIAFVICESKFWRSLTNDQIKLKIQVN